MRDVARLCARPSGIGSSASCQAAWCVLQGWAVQGWAERFPNETLLVSSHGNAISLYLRYLDADFGFMQWKGMQKPDLFGTREGTWNRVATHQP